MSGEDHYILQRDWQASCRLNLQTYLWKDSLNYVVHPDIPSLPSGARVADVGTGTGIWLTQLHTEKQDESIKLDGFDIDIAQCPRQEWMPPNISFQQWNATQPPPEELHGKFDLVHLRLVMIGINNDEITTLADNLCKLLKPGGWLQWEEMNNYDNKIVAINDSVPTTSITEVLNWMTQGPKEKRGGKEWRLYMPEILQEHGFSNVSIKNHEDPPFLRRWLTEVTLTTLNEFASKQFAKDSKEALWLAKVSGDAHEECKQGAAIHMGKLLLVAQKNA